MGAISVALSVAMVIGIFAGTGMDYTVKGKDDNGTDVKFNFYLLYCSGEIDTANLNSLNAIKQFMDVTASSSNSSIRPTSDWSHIFRVETFGGISKWDMKGVLVKNANNNSYGFFYIFLTPAKNSTSETPSSSAEQSDSSHTHSYSWETVQEATIWQDGIEEYRCSCGDVQERSVIPASAAVADGFCNAVGNAP